MPPAVLPPVIPLPAPPDSAVIVWAIPTNSEVIRCLAWEDDNNNGWWIAIVFGKETLKIDRVPDLDTLWYAAELFQCGLAPSFDFLTLGGDTAGARRIRARRHRQELARSGDR
jgi:hypothetical protein